MATRYGDKAFAVMDLCPNPKYDPCSHFFPRADRQTDRQKGRQKDRQTEADTHTHTYTHTQAERERDRQTHTHTHKTSFLFLSLLLPHLITQTALTRVSVH